jgi:hypothetical protein
VTAQQQQQAVVPVESLNLPAYLLWFDNNSGIFDRGGVSQ